NIPAKTFSAAGEHLNLRFYRLWKGRKCCIPDSDILTSQNWKWNECALLRWTFTLRPLNANGLVHSTPFQFSAHPLRWVIHGGSMQANHTAGHSDPMSLLRLLLLPFQNGTTRLDFKRKPPHGSTFCGFLSCERASLSLPTVAFQFYGPTLQMDNNRR
ncbi:hypothetical protein AVEN_201775-2-1, partial [Araneus ventricosus]